MLFRLFLEFDHALFEGEEKILERLNFVIKLGNSVIRIGLLSDSSSEYILDNDSYFSLELEALGKWLIGVGTD